ncbi:MAG: DUF29 domain-containing protein [Alphaproteobacteria bacterium]|nr:DUF29 domain-containing protein [Alphaproteobacteria bacterium]
MTTSSLYERDFHAWANEQAALLRQGKLNTADIEHIAEEIESMGRAERRELVNRLTILLLHLLKWRFQPGRRGASWETTIAVQRDDLRDHLRDNPSLKSTSGEALTDAYRKAAILATGETGFPKSTFPVECPWSLEQGLDDAFWPE